MIAETVVLKALNRIAALNPQKVLILGNGSIGSSINLVLKGKYDVQIYDPYQVTSEITNSNFDSHLQKFDLIIGCTGNTSLPYSIHVFLKKGCILFSASSSDREFDAVYIRKECHIVSYCHQDIKTDRINLLNCGFPINFNGDRNSVPIDKIQLTRALLLAAFFQALDTDESPAIIDLDIEIQQDIVKRYLSLTSITVKPFKSRFFHSEISIE
jgi:hypothetical protein